METERFFSDMGEDFERAAKGFAPRVSLEGWWWKRYIPYFRRMREVSQMIVEGQWERNREEVEMIIKEVERRERNELVRGMRNY